MVAANFNLLPNKLNFCCRKLFKGGNNSRAETIRRNTVGKNLVKTNRLTYTNAEVGYIDISGKS